MLVLMNQRFALLGASRGLGWATYSNLLKRYNFSSGNKSVSDIQFLLMSRKIKDQFEHRDTKSFPVDFSKLENVPAVQNELIRFQPTHLIYFAGGGPYGNFESKNWSDHDWALKTTLLFPAQLLHSVLKEKAQFSNLKQIVCIGSAIAENKPDPMAASYCAAKHGLKGLLSTLQVETTSIKIDLFSPGYMQTDLLPPNSPPRQLGLAEDVEIVAQRLIAILDLENHKKQ